MRPMTKSPPKISVHGLWTWIVMKTNDAGKFDLSQLPRADREYALQLLDTLVRNIRTEGDIGRFERLLDEISNGDALETLERIALRF